MHLIYNWVLSVIFIVIYVCSIGNSAKLPPYRFQLPDESLYGPDSREDRKSASKAQFPYPFDATGNGTADGLFQGGNLHQRLLYEMKLLSGGKQKNVSRKTREQRIKETRDPHGEKINLVPAENDAPQSTRADKPSVVKKSESSTGRKFTPPIFRDIPEMMFFSEAGVTRVRASPSGTSLSALSERSKLSSDPSSQLYKSIEETEAKQIRQMNDSVEVRPKIEDLNQYLQMNGGSKMSDTNSNNHEKIVIIGGSRGNKGEKLQNVFRDQTQLLRANAEDKSKAMPNFYDTKSNGRIASLGKIINPNNEGLGFRTTNSTFNKPLLSEDRSSKLKNSTGMLMNLETIPHVKPQNFQGKEGSGVTQTTDAVRAKPEVETAATNSTFKASSFQTDSRKLQQEAEVLSKLVNNFRKMSDGAVRKPKSHTRDFTSGFSLTRSEALNLDDVMGNFSAALYSCLTNLTPRHETAVACAQDGLTTALDQVVSAEKIRIVSGVSLIRQRGSVRDTSSEEDDMKLKDVIPLGGWLGDVMDKIGMFFRDFSLDVSLDEIDFGLEGRGHHHYRRVFPIVVTTYMIMSTFLIPMGFQFMAMLGGKALVLSKLAFLWSLFGLSRRVFPYPYPDTYGAHDFHHQTGHYRAAHRKDQVQ